MRTDMLSLALVATVWRLSSCIAAVATGAAGTYTGVGNARATDACVMVCHSQPPTHAMLGSCVAVVASAATRGRAQWADLTLRTRVVCVRHTCVSVGGNTPLGMHTRAPVPVVGVLFRLDDVAESQRSFGCTGVHGAGSDAGAQRASLAVQAVPVAVVLLSLGDAARSARSGVHGAGSDAAERCTLM